MLKLIGSIFKATLLVLVILVLSHIVEIKGVSVSQHVLRGMTSVSGFSPSRQINQITENYSQALKTRVEEIRKIDPGVEPAIEREDQIALSRVIEQSKKRK
jgi:hypothetical protein